MEKGQKVGRIFTSTAFTSVVELVDSKSGKLGFYKFATNVCQISTSWTFFLGKIEQLAAMQLGQKERQRQWTIEAASLSEDAPLILTNEESLCVLPSKEQVETKKSKSKAIEFVCKELRSLRSGMDVVAMALEKGNLRNYTEEQLYDEITKVIAPSELHLFFFPSRFSHSGLSCQ